MSIASSNGDNNTRWPLLIVVPMRVFIYSLVRAERASQKMLFPCVPNCSIYDMIRQQWQPLNYVVIICFQIFCIFHVKVLQTSEISTIDKCVHIITNEFFTEIWKTIRSQLVNYVATWVIELVSTDYIIFNAIFLLDDTVFRTCNLYTTYKLS